jgi:hypothetical protein
MTGRGNNGMRERRKEGMTGTILPRPHSKNQVHNYVYCILYIIHTYIHIFMFKWQWMLGIVDLHRYQRHCTAPLVALLLRQLALELVAAHFVKTGVLGTATTGSSRVLHSRTARWGGNQWQGGVRTNAYDGFALPDTGRPAPGGARDAGATAADGAQRPAGPVAPLWERDADRRWL